MAKRKYAVPLDTLGHPLPPPVPSYTTCKIPRRGWAKWWHDFYNDRLPEDKDCCVCGFWFTLDMLTALNTELVEPRIQRQYLNSMMLKNIFMCKDCRKKCNGCNRYIPNAQKTRFNNLCHECHTAQLSTPKEIRKRPTSSASRPGSPGTDDPTRSSPVSSDDP
jgi:hypothetical protein